MSIRLRLTLLYSVILGVALVAFAIFVYALLQRNLTIQMDGTLRTNANSTARFYGGRLDDPDRDSGRELAARLTVFRNGTTPSPSSGAFVQVVDPSGAVLVRSLNLVSADVALPAPDGSVRGPRLETVKVGDEQLRLIIQPTLFQPPARPDVNSGFVEVALPLTEIQNALDHLRNILALGVAGALLLAGVAGWLLSTTALRPIARLTEAAHEIGEAQDFGRRVAYEGPHDEVGRLAGTFNGMLSRLEAAYARIQRALEAQRRFVADASHELRTPLTTIRGNVELLALDDEGESGERREALEDIASEAERMSRLVTDLLVLARADAGLRIQRDPVKLRPLVEEVSRQVRRTSGTVQLQVEEIPDVVVSGSADHLRQLLLILLDNARKYSPPEGVIRLRAERSHGWVRLSVSDEGPGIPKAEQERIFDRFYRLDLSRHGEGSGLGLAIARWIATEHDGRLTVESEPGAGSTFTLALPVLRQPDASTDRRAEAAVSV